MYFLFLPSIRVFESLKNVPSTDSVFKLFFQRLDKCFLWAKFLMSQGFNFISSDLLSYHNDFKAWTFSPLPYVSRVSPMGCFTSTACMWLTEPTRPLSLLDKFLCCYVVWKLATKAAVGHRLGADRLYKQTLLWGRHVSLLMQSPFIEFCGDGDRQISTSIIMWHIDSVTSNLEVMVEETFTIF